MVAGQSVAGQYHMVFYIYDTSGHEEEEASEGSIKGSIKGWKKRRLLLRVQGGVETSSGW